MNDSLIDSDTLERRTRSGDDVVVFDARFDLADPAQGRRLYMEGHIPDARFIDLEDDLSDMRVCGQGRHPLPNLEVLVAKMRMSGVGKDTLVVAYDQGPGAFAARLWWLMRRCGHERAAVLDGGWADWTAGGRAVETSAPGTQRPGDFERVGPGCPLVTTAEVAALDRAEWALVDARAPERFRGQMEPIDPVAGHIPGAVNRPFLDSLEATGRFKSADALRRSFEEKAAGKKLVHMCGSGVTACHNALAAHIAGLGMGALYAASWSGWLEQENPSVETRP